MISNRQVPYKTPIGGGESPIIAIFQQLWQPIFVGSWMVPWVTFHTGSLTKCYGYAVVGTFTAKIYINAVHVFTVTNADNPTPVNLVDGETGELLVPDLVTCEITACSSDVDGILIQAL